MRLVVADDSAIVRDGLAHLLASRGHEAAAVADSAALLRETEQTRPDVAVIDIRMPPTHTNEGLAAAAEIRERFPGTGVLVLSQYVEVEYALRLLQEHPSASGYLLKDRITQADALLDAIDRVAQGETVVDRELVDLLLDRRAGSRLAALTDRERTVLGLVAEGLTDRAIAERLWLTPKTVETHVRHILAKLALPQDGQSNRRVLAVLAYLRESGPDVTESHR